MGRADLNYWRLTHDNECLIAVNKNGPLISFAGFNSSSFEQSKKTKKKRPLTTIGWVIFVIVGQILPWRFISGQSPYPCTRFRLFFGGRYKIFIDILSFPNRMSV